MNDKTGAHERIAELVEAIARETGAQIEHVRVEWVESLGGAPHAYAVQVESRMIR